MRRVIVLIATLVLLLVAAPADARDRHDYRRYLAVGDSITAGYDTTDHATNAYPVVAHIRSLSQPGGCWSPECASTSFEQSIYPRLRALPNQPSTLVVELGINDLGMGITYDLLISRVSAWMALLADNGYRVVLGTIVPSAPNAWSSDVVISNGHTVHWNRLMFNRWVRTQASYVEYARPLQCSNGYLCPQFESQTYHDVHPNDAGHRVMARKLRQWIERDAR